MADRVLFWPDGGGQGPAPVQLVDTGRTVNGLAVYAIAMSAQGAAGANQTMIATGPAAAGAAISGNPILVAGSDGTLVRTQFMNTLGQASVNTEGRKLTYSAAANGITMPASAVDTFVIGGSASKLVRVLRISVSGVQTTAGTVGVILALRSAADTGAANAITAVPHDSTNGAATATVKTYTTVPSPQGAFVGTVRAGRLFLPAPASVASPIPLVWDFTTRNGQGLALRGTAEILAVNFNGVTITGGVMDFDVEWTEE